MKDVQAIKNEVDVLQKVLKDNHENSKMPLQSTIDVAEYTYNTADLNQFDSKIDVCKWFTRQIGELKDGVYDISVRKDGLMCEPTVISQLACQNAYNYFMYEYAYQSSSAYTKTESFSFNYVKSDGTTGQTPITSYVNRFRAATLSNIDWIISRPYVFKNDFIENNIRNRVFDVKTIDDNLSIKSANNCIVCYDPQATEDYRIVVTVLGFGHHYDYYITRSQKIRTEDTVNALKYTTVESMVKDSHNLNYDLYQRAIGELKTVLPATANYALYYSVHKVYPDGTSEVMYYTYKDEEGVSHTVVLEDNKLKDSSRMSVPTCSTILLLAKYLVECNEDEEVDCCHLSAAESQELIRTLNPYDTNSLNYRNRFLGTNTNLYGTNRTLEKKFYISLSKLFRFACLSNNTYAIYDLMLHIYKGLTHISKDTISPLIESKTSWDDGHIEISFPEAYRSSVQTAGGESSLQFITDKVLCRAFHWIKNTTEYVEWDNVFVPDINNIYHRVDLEDDYINFNNFSTGDCFTLGLAFRYRDVVQLEESITENKETLIATIGDTEIYFCKNKTGIYPGIASRTDPSNVYKYPTGLKIKDENQQLYFGLGPPYYVGYNITVGSTTYNMADANVIITLSYNNGLWDCHQYFEGRGR